MLDTNMVSHLIKGHALVARRLQSVPIKGVCISAITEAELLFGLAKRPAATRLRKVVNEFLLCTDILGWDTLVAAQYGALRAQLERAGQMLAPMDLMIASHARCEDAILVTNDAVFLQVPKLVCEDWTEQAQA